VGSLRSNYYHSIAYRSQLSIDHEGTPVFFYVRLSQRQQLQLEVGLDTFYSWVIIIMKFVTNEADWREKLRYTPFGGQADDLLVRADLPTPPALMP